MKNIVLIGMPGCGKSEIGKILAQKTEMEFIDVDAYLLNRVISLLLLKYLKMVRIVLEI